MNIDEGAKCRKGVLHKLEGSTNMPDAIVEVCVLCSEKKIYNKGKDGRIDNAKYLREHVASFVQPGGITGKLFEKLYGHDGVEKLYKLHGGKKSKEKIREEWEETRRDIANRLEKNRIFV